MDIRITIVGCGAVAFNHYKKPLQKMERQGILTVVALVDKNLNRAEQLRRFFPRASLYEDIEEAIHKNGSNLTIVASPPAFHAKHSIIALQNRNHVLCEKPMAITTTQCDQMIQSSKDSGRQLGIVMPRRFYPSLIELKNLILNGELGEISAFSHHECMNYSWPVMTFASFRRMEGGGGVLFDTGPHVLDTIIWLFGNPSIRSYSDDAILDGVEANCVIWIEAAGSSGSVHLSRDHDFINELRITGSKAEAIVRLDQFGKLAIKRPKGYEIVTPRSAFPMTIAKRNTRSGAPRQTSMFIYFQMIQFIRAIELGEYFPASGEEGKQVISLIEECYRIARPIDMTWLPMSQNARHKQLHWSRK